MRLHSLLKVTLGTIFVMAFVTACAGCDTDDAPPPAPPPAPTDTGGFDSGPVDDRGVDEVPDAKLVTIYFDYDRAAIRDDQKSALRANANAIKAGSWSKVVVTGHCDERGSEEYNLALGERRANAVKQYLIDSGVRASRIDTVSFGESQPAVRGHDEGAWSRNRRGEFRVVN